MSEGSFRSVVKVFFVILVESVAPSTEAWEVLLEAVFEQLFLECHVVMGLVHVKATAEDEIGHAGFFAAQELAFVVSFLTNGLKNCQELVHTASLFIQNSFYHSLLFYGICFQTWPVQLFDNCS